MGVFDSILGDRSDDQLAVLRQVLHPLEGHDLIPTLKAFLENNGHFESAAAALHVHRHTMRNRLGRISELLAASIQADIRPSYYSPCGPKRCSAAAPPDQQEADVITLTYATDSRSSGLGWQEDAACRDHPAELFFPDELRGESQRLQESEAKAICQSCPGLIQCAEHAMRARKLRRLGRDDCPRTGFTPGAIQLALPHGSQLGRRPRDQISSEKLDRIKSRNQPFSPIVSIVTRALALHRSGAPSGTRTHTVRILSPLPLPIGL